MAVPSKMLAVPILAERRYVSSASAIFRISSFGQVVLIALSPHHSMGFRSRKKPPVGPLSGRVASQTAVSAPSSGLLVAPSPPIRVRTQPGHIALTLTEDGSSLESRTVSALSAAFVTPYKP